MRECTQMFVKEWIEYKDFLQKCREKQYDSALVLHKHHIIPKNHGGKDIQENYVMLSVEDHCHAHILFALCFEPETAAHNANMRSARLLKKKSIVLREDLEKMIAESYIGANNPFYGKKHSKESIEKAKKTKNLRGTAFRGISYDERYGDKSEIEKTKRAASVKTAWSKLTEEQKAKRLKNLVNSSKSLTAEERTAKAKKAANSKLPLLKINGMLFESMADAGKHFNMSAWFIRKQFTIEKIEKEKHE